MTLHELITLTEGMRIFLTLTTVVAIFSLFLSVIIFITILYMTKEINSLKGKNFDTMKMMNDKTETTERKMSAIYDVLKYQNVINEEVGEELNTSLTERKEIAQALNKLFELRDRDTDRLYEALSQIELLKEAVNMKKDVAGLFGDKDCSFTTYDIEEEKEQNRMKISLETNELQKTGTSE